MPFLDWIILLGIMSPLGSFKLQHPRKNVGMN